jgi:hypothetical protein
LILTSRFTQNNLSMLGWLKDKVTGKPNARAAEELRAEFAPLEQVPGAPRRLANRLADFVLTGDGESALSDIAAMTNTHMAMPYIFTYIDGGERKGLIKLINLLPQDPQVLLRLAKVYDALRRIGGGGHRRRRLAASAAASSGQRGCQHQGAENSRRSDTGGTGIDARAGPLSHRVIIVEPAA